VSSDPIEQRAAKVSSVTGLSAVLSIVLQLIAVPICLTHWGKETYGSWLALYAAFMMVRSIDAGFVSYVGNKLNYLYHQSHADLHRHLASSLVGTAIIGVIQLTIGIAAVFSDGLLRSLGLLASQGDQNHSRLALLVLIGTWVLSGSYLGIVHRLLIPTGFMYQATWWAMGLQVGQFSAILLAAFQRLDMLHTSLLLASVQFGIYTASGVYVRLKLPAFFPWWRGGVPRTGIQDLGHSLSLTASNLIQQGSASGIVILVSILTSPAIVPVFTTARVLANLWTNISNVLTAPMLPDVVRFAATGEGRKLVTLSEAYWVIVGSILNLGVLLTYPFVEGVFGHWTAHSIALNKPLHCFLLASVVVSNVGGLFSLYFNGNNHVGVLLMLSILRGVAGLLLGGLLFMQLGLVGIGIAIMGGEVLVLILLSNQFMRRELPRQGGTMPMLSIAPILISSACVVAFLMYQGFQSRFSAIAFTISSLGVLTCAVWGWRRLEVGVRDRLVRLVKARFGKRFP